MEVPTFCTTTTVYSKLQLAETGGFKEVIGHFPSLLLKLNHDEARRQEKGIKNREGNC